MSKEQANTFKRFRDADDAMGNLGWASKMSKRSVLQAVEAPSDIEKIFGFSVAERVLWRLMKIPRRYSDIETSSLLPPEKIRGILRGMVAADVLDIGDDPPRALVPLEIKRMIRAVKGGPEKQRPVKRKSIAERVYRPNINGENGAVSAEAAPVEATPEAPSNAPAAVSFGDDEVPTSNAASGEPLDAKTWAIKKKIIAAFDLHGSAPSHYEFLGLTPQAKDDAIHNAYVSMAREYHPDTLAGTALDGDAEVRGMLDAVFKRVQEANSTLGKPDKRAQYDRELASGTVREEGAKVRRTQEALVMLAKGDTFFRRKDYANAEKHFHTAMSLDDQEPRVLTKYAWVLWLNPTRSADARGKEASKLLQEVIDKHKFGDAAYKLGLLKRVQGDEKSAQRHFADALRLDPRHADAKQERRLGERRRRKQEQDAAQADKKSKSLFERFKK